MGGIKEARLRISGMRCAGCAARIEKALRDVRGVIDANVDLGSGLAIVRYDPGLVRVEEIKRVIEGLGYKALEGEGPRAVRPSWR